MNLRGIICTALMALVVIFAIAGTATPVVTFKIGTAEGGFTLWKTCLKSSSSAPETCTSWDDNWGCSTQKDRFGAARAFCILTILVAVAGVVVAVMDILEKLPMPLIIMGAVFGAVCFFALLAFAIDVSIYTTKLCDNQSAYKDINGTSMGPGPILMIIAWLISIPAIVVTFLVKPPEQSAAVTPAPAAK